MWDKREPEQPAEHKHGSRLAIVEREVRPHVPDAWMDRSKDKVGYERAPRRGTRSLRISTTQLTYINIVV